MDNRLCYEGWDLTTSPVPPRTVLYSLPPIGIGTDHVESLTSYLSRLAAAHAVPAGALIARELRPRLAPSRPALSPSGTLGISREATVPSNIYILNGVGVCPQRWVHLLQQLTGQSGLCFLTALCWGDAIASHAVVRRQRAWCSQCYAEWRAAGQAIWEPLLWAFTAVQECIHHRCLLQERCPACGRQFHQLTSRSRAGYCYFCQQWLGTSHPDMSTAPAALSSSANVVRWATETLAEFVRAAPTLPARPSREGLRANLRTCIQEVSGGSLEVFARLARAAPISVSCWMTGKTRPRLDVLLRISYRLGLPVLTLVSTPPTTFTADWAQVKDTVQRTQWADVEPSRQQRGRLALVQALQSSTPPSVAEIARQVGYASPVALRRLDPERYQQLVRRSRATTSACHDRSRQPPASVAVVEMVLREALQQDEIPSLQHLAHNLGYADPRSLKDRAPTLSRALVVKRTTHGQQRKRTQEQLLRAALKEDPPPTVGSLAQRLGYKSSAILRRRWPGLYAALVKRSSERNHNRWRRLNTALVVALREEPPPSLATIAQRVAQHPTTLRNHFPELARQVCARFLAAQHSHVAQRQQQQHLTIRQIVTALAQQGVYPSYRRVQQSLGDLPRLNFARFQAAVQEARQALGIPLDTSRGRCPSVQPLTANGAVPYAVHPKSEA
jgi:AraC-like DNA-binding protein